MKRGRVFVKAADEKGRFGTVDALDLDDDSFRAFILDRLVDAQVIIAVPSDDAPGPDIIYRTKPGIRIAGT